MESKFYHEHDCVTGGTGKDRFSYFYDQGPIIRVDTDGSYDRYTGELGSATILYRDDSRFSWKSKYVNCVFQGQVGIAVSPDGHFLFLPTWDLGFHCVDAKNGDRIWSKRYGVTNVFVLKNTLVCQRPYKALQLLDLHTGELLQERRVPAWGFTSLNHRYIICHVKETHRDNHWDIIKAATLETVQSIPQRTLTGDHEYACVRDIVWKPEGELLVSGFKDSRGRSKDEFSVRIKCVDLSV